LSVGRVNLTRDPVWTGIPHPGKRHVIVRG
jgi:hypothetical protein